GIVQPPVFPLAARGLFRMRMIFGTSMIALFQRQPPQRITISPTRYSTGTKWTCGHSCPAVRSSEARLHLCFLVYTAPMPGKRAFEEQIAALEKLRHEPEQARADGLRKALKSRNNFIVGKAADLVRELGLPS